MGTVTTTTSATATAYGNQRKLDRTSNGVLWEIQAPSGNSSAAFTAAYSTDGGTTWANAGGLPQTSDGGTAESYTPNASGKIDEDDYLHVSYKDKRNGYIYYVRGTPNAARTAYTWSAATAVYNSGTSLDYPDLVAHREGSGWAVHVVGSSTGNETGRVFYFRGTVTSGGSVSFTGLTTIGATPAAVSIPAYASIDFNHTGDGKTVAGSTPHLYVGWSAGATGAGYGIRFRKATYASGSLTWGTEREIDNTAYISGASEWLTCHYDGTRVVLSGYLYTGSANKVVVHDRDASDPASGGTTLRTVLASPMATADQLFSGTSTFDALGNVWLFGSDASGGNAACKANYRKWVRATSTLEAVVTFDSTARPQPFVSARRGPQGQAIDYVYTDGTASPYTVSSGRIALNQNPAATTPVSPADNAALNSEQANNVVFTHNDPDGDAASAWRIRYRPAGTSVAYQFLTGTTTAANNTSVTATVPAGTWVGVIEYASQTYDPANTEGAWSTTRTVTALPATLTAATGGQGGTSLHAQTVYNTTETDRTKRALALV